MPEYVVTCLLHDSKVIEDFTVNNARNKRAAKNWVRKNFYVKKIIKIKRKKI